MFNFGFKRRNNGMPGANYGLLVHLKAPNSDNITWTEDAEWDESLLWIGYALPLNCFAAVGVGPWFTNSLTPITRLMSDILADTSINQYHILASATKGVAVYDPYTVSDATIVKADRYFKATAYSSVPTAYFDGVSIAGSTGFDNWTTGQAPGQWVLAHQGLPGDPMVLVNAGCDVPAIEGARLEWVVGSNPELCTDPYLNDSSGTWVKTNVIVAGGVAALSASGSLRSAFGCVAGKKYRIVYEVTAVTGTGVQCSSGSAGYGTVRTTTGIFSEDLIAQGTALFYWNTGASGTATIDNISIQELLPTWRDTYLDGTPILPSVDQPTRTSGTVLDGTELGPDIVPQPLSFASWWATTGSTPSTTGMTITTAGAGGYWKDNQLTPGKTYKIEVAGSTTCASGFSLSDAGPSFAYMAVKTGSFNYSALVVAGAGADAPYAKNESSGTTTLTTLSIKEVLPALTNVFTQDALVQKRYDRDADPLLMSGYLSEPARTNILYNSLLVGGATPTSWGWGYSTGTSSYAASAGCADAISYTLSVSGTRQYLAQSRAVSASSVYTFSAEIESISGTLRAVDVLAITANPVESLVAYPICQANPSGGSVGVLTTGTLIITLTVSTTAGTCEFRVGPGANGVCTGSVKLSRPQVELGAFKTSFIGTPAAAGMTRGGTVLPFSTLGKIRSNNIAFLMTVVPRASGQNGHLFSIYFDINNRIVFTINAASDRIYLAKRLNGTFYEPFINYTLVPDKPFQLVFAQSSTKGMECAARSYVSGSWGDFGAVAANTTAGGKANILVPATYQIGSSNSVEQFTGNISELETLFIPDGLHPDAILPWVKRQFGVE